LVEEREWFRECLGGGDAEYLKERGTSMLKRRVRARDASGGNADDVDSYYQIGRVALRTVQSRAGQGPSGLNLKRRELGCDDPELRAEQTSKGKAREMESTFVSPTRRSDTA
jgi:hypothetical protein